MSSPSIRRTHIRTRQTHTYIHTRLSHSRFFGALSIFSFFFLLCFLLSAAVSIYSRSASLCIDVSRYIPCLSRPGQPFLQTHSHALFSFASFPFCCVFLAWTAQQFPPNVLLSLFLLPPPSVSFTSRRTMQGPISLPISLSLPPSLSLSLIWHLLIHSRVSLDAFQERCEKGRARVEEKNQYSNSYLLKRSVMASISTSLAIRSSALDMLPVLLQPNTES